jgi:hypothetical protein
MQARLYFAIIGDLVDSRGLAAPERRALQTRLSAHLGALSPAGKTGVAARPLITLGDEFQALFAATDAGIQSALELMTAVLELVRPAAVRCGLGVGTLSTDLQEQALGMDGPCFHRARSALERCRSTGLLCQLESDGGPLDSLWSALASYALHQRLDWTEAQREAIDLYDELGAWNKVAAKLGVSPSAVSLRHQAAGWALYRAARASLPQGLRRVVEMVTEDTAQQERA